MFRRRIIPCLLLKNKGLVKTVKFKDSRYVGDPINAVKVFNDKEVDELVFLDITATQEQREPPVDLLANIASEAFMPFAYGGGIRSLDMIRELFRLGIEKAVINSYAFENPSFIKEAADCFGSQSIIVSIDVRKNLFGKYEVCTNGGRKKTGQHPLEYARKMEKLGAGEIFLNAIDRDGMQNGYDIELTKMVSEGVGIPVIACGGAGKVEDFQCAIEEGKASAVAAGSMFVFVGPNRAVLINYQIPQGF